MEFQKEKSHVVFGMRHAPAGGNKMLSGRILKANLYDQALEAEAIAASAGVENDYVSEAAILAVLDDEQKKKREQLKKEIEALQVRREELEAAAKSHYYTVIAKNPGTMKIHRRGSVTDFGEEMTPGAIGSIPGVTADFGLAKNAPDAARRKKLADWVTDESNPLFVRVMMNRIWHYHFGTGIVETPSDLGFNGGRPSHRELLDWMSKEFRSNGFRLKPMHRLIVLSSTYRQSSANDVTAANVDADNRLLWRFSPRRIEAEVLRDSMLEVAGVLNRKQGGPGFEDVKITPNNGTTYYEPIDPEGSEFNRRTIYRFTPRGGRSAILDTFDCPDPSSAAPRRSLTTTPLQALSLLNNSFVLRMAERTAKRVEQERAQHWVDKSNVPGSWCYLACPTKKKKN